MEGLYLSPGPIYGTKSSMAIIDPNNNPYKIADSILIGVKNSKAIVNATEKNPARKPIEMIFLSCIFSVETCAS